VPDLVQLGGDFSDWLRATDDSLNFRSDGVDVPCGSCRGCCRSSLFIHIAPDEEETLRAIPRELLFDAPGYPEGHLLMGYTDQGHCPMLVDGNCSIYEHRPRTCRHYDCRALAATGMSAEEHAQPEVAERVKQWVFTYRTEQDRARHAAVQRAAAFLRDHGDLFPPRSLPGYPGALAAIAVQVRHLFEDGAPAEPDTAIVDAILTTLD
jgi:uncharacterized protein